MPRAWTLSTAAALAFLISHPSLGEVDGVTCESSAGNCEVTSFYDDGSTTGTDISVAPMEGVTAFVTTIDFAGRRDLAVPWQRPSAPTAQCQQEIPSPSPNRGPRSQGPAARRRPAPARLSR
jgi:hypothetical protein